MRSLRGAIGSTKEKKRESYVHQVTNQRNCVISSKEIRYNNMRSVGAYCGLDLWVVFVSVGISFLLNVYTHTLLMPTL